MALPVLAWRGHIQWLGEGGAACARQWRRRQGRCSLGLRARRPADAVGDRPRPAPRRHHHALCAEERRREALPHRQARLVCRSPPAHPPHAGGAGAAPRLRRERKAFDLRRAAAVRRRLPLAGRQDGLDEAADAPAPDADRGGRSLHAGSGGAESRRGDGRAGDRLLPHGPRRAGGAAHRRMGREAGAAALGRDLHANRPRGGAEPASLRRGWRTRASTIRWRCRSGSMSRPSGRTAPTRWGFAAASGSPASTGCWSSPAGPLARSGSTCWSRPWSGLAIPTGCCWSGLVRRLRRPSR